MALSLTDKIVGFIVRPVETYRAVRDEEFAAPSIYFLVLLIIDAILTAIVAYLGLAAVDANTPRFDLGLGGSIGAFIAGLIIAFIVGIVALLLWAVFLHIGAKIMSGRGDFADSFKSAVYAQTPNLLLGVDPDHRHHLLALVDRAAVPRRPRAPRARHDEGRDRGRDRSGALHHRRGDPWGSLVSPSSAASLRSRACTRPSDRCTPSFSTFH